jgi:hypothetical protein
MFDIVCLGHGGRKMRKLSLIIAILIFLPVVYVASKPSSVFKRETGGRTVSMGNVSASSGLEVSVRTDNTLYNPGGVIRLEVQLMNADDGPIYLYGNLSWGYSASLTLHVLDTAGKEIPAKYLDDSLTPPPPPNDKSFFVNLNPKHFFGTTREMSLDELNINKPDKYKIMVEYHSPIPQSFGQGLPLWGREKGSIRSRIVEFEVASNR